MHTEQLSLQQLILETDVADEKHLPLAVIAAHDPQVLDAAREDAVQAAVRNCYCFSPQEIKRRERRYEEAEEQVTSTERRNTLRDSLEEAQANAAQMPEYTARADFAGTIRKTQLKLSRPMRWAATIACTLGLSAFAANYSENVEQQGANPFAVGAIGGLVIYAGGRAFAGDIARTRAKRNLVTLHTQYTDSTNSSVLSFNKPQ